MPKFLIQVKYSPQGIKGVVEQGGSARVAQATRLIEGLGGKLESFHFAFGGTDVYVIADMPDNTAAAAGPLIIGSAGTECTTVVLITPEEMDEAAKKAQTETGYRPPG